MGAEVHVCGPPSLVPTHLASLGVKVHAKLEPALADADFVMALRLQLERQQQGLIPSIGEYRQLYGLNHDRLQAAKPNVRVMHPGPVNRGIEVTDDLIDDPNISLLTRQVANGIPVRMAALLLLLSSEETIPAL
jgi:aspartate carbamoyltransferase catalytic subunit